MDASALLWQLRSDGGSREVRPQPLIKIVLVRPELTFVETVDAVAVFGMNIETYQDVFPASIVFGAQGTALDRTIFFADNGRIGYVIYYGRIRRFSVVNEIPGVFTLFLPVEYEGPAHFFFRNPDHDEMIGSRAVGFFRKQVPLQKAVALGQVVAEHATGMHKCRGVYLIDDAILGRSIDLLGIGSLAGTER